MNAIALVTKRNLLLNKSRSLTLLFGLILAVTLTVVSVSLYLCLQDYLLSVAASLSEQSAGTLAVIGIKNLAEFFYTLIYNETASNLSADILFSAEALLQNTPVLLIIIGVLTLLIAYLSVKITFKVGSSDRTRFYGLLLAAGANTRHLRKSALYETLYLCALGIPAGLLLGTGGTALTSQVFKHIFLHMARTVGITEMPMTITPRLLALLTGILFGFLAVLYCTLKSVKRVGKHTIFEAMGDTDFVDLGISSFTPDDGYYKVVGLEGHLGIRNFQSQIFRYLTVSFMMTTYVTVVLATLYTFGVVKDYNSELFDGVISQALAATDRSVAGMILITEIYFCTAAALMSVTALTGTFNMIAANVTANFGEYAILRSTGMTLKSIRKSVRAEGLLCAVISLCICWFITLVFCAVLMIKVEGFSNMKLSVPLVGLLLPVGAFLLTVAAAVAHADRRLKKADLITLLKDECY